MQESKENKNEKQEESKVNEDISNDNINEPCDDKNCNCSCDDNNSKCSCESKEETNILEDKVIELEAKLNIANENVLRAMAEAENVRKRTEKDRADYIKRANKDLVVSLINFMDDFDRAIEVGENDTTINSTEFYKGITLIRKRFIDFLNSNGVEEIEALGSDFDPNTHEALQVIESDDVKTEKVSQVYMKGYTLNSEVVRSPKVVVSKPKS